MNKKLAKDAKECALGKHPIKWLKFQLFTQCPRCNSKLWEVGYYDMLYGQRYKCSDKECGWGW